MQNKTECIDILSLVTHDLKSPLSAIFGALDLLSMDDLSKKDKEMCIKSAKKASKSVLNLIDSILVMAKLEAGKVDVEFEQVENLQEHFEDIIQIFKYETIVKNIKISLKLPLNLPHVYWDMDKLRYHVINNIISNAIKFTDIGGNIKISVKNLDDKYIRVSIKDNGIGIDKKKMKTIFEKYDTHNNQKVFKGTGLGLFNAHNFVKRHNGYIRVTKGISGKGTGFVITLPVNPEF